MRSKRILLQFIICATLVYVGSTFRLSAAESQPYIGIGYITDSAYNVSYQYTVYKMLETKPLYAKGAKVQPMLTLRRGLTAYYLSGHMNTTSARCNVWYKGKLLSTISLNALSKRELYNLFYQRLKDIVDDNNSASEGTKQTIRMKEYGITDITKTEARYNMPVYGKNCLPELTYYNEVLAAHLYSVNRADRQVCDYISSSAFAGLSYKRKINYIRSRVGTSAAMDVRTIYPRPKKHQFLYKDDVEMAASVVEFYDTQNVHSFLLTSNFVSYSLQQSFKETIFPLWKRSGTVLTYLQAGINFSDQHIPDAALECYSSALIMVDGLAVCPSFKQYLKGRILAKMADAYKQNGQGASAVIAERLGKLHFQLQHSAVLAAADKDYLENVNKLSEFYSAVERDARDAKGKSRMATWGAIASTAGAATSVYVDGKNGQTDLSATTQTNLQNATTGMMATTDLKEASLSATGKASEVYQSAFRDLIKEIQAENNDYRAPKAIFAFDFISLVVNDQVLMENKAAIQSFVQLTPELKTSVEAYYTNNDVVHLSAIWKQFSKLEKSIYGKESLGISTTATDIKL